MKEFDLDKAMEESHHQYLKRVIPLLPIQFILILVPIFSASFAKLKWLAFFDGAIMMMNTVFFIMSLRMIKRSVDDFKEFKRLRIKQKELEKKLKDDFDRIKHELSTEFGNSKTTKGAADHKAN